MEEIHIGERIKQRAEELRIGTTERGKIIGVTKQGIYRIHRQKTINTGRLQQLCVALDFDFFALYVKSPVMEDTDITTV